MSEAVERLNKLMANAEVSSGGWETKQLYTDKIVTISIVKTPSNEFRIQISLGFKNRILIPPEYINSVINAIELLETDMYRKIIEDMKTANKLLVKTDEDLIKEIYGSI